MRRPDARLVHLAEQVHDLGPLPLAHLLAELEAGADVRDRAEAYARLPADFIRQYGGDRNRREPMVITGGRP